MIRLIAVAGFALAVATSTQAMTAAPIYWPYSMITQVAWGCGRAGHGSMASAWPELPSGKPAGVCDGQDTFAPSTIIIEKTPVPKVGLDQLNFDFLICLSAGEESYWM